MRRTFKNSDYKTFICYRRKKYNKNMMPSEDVAGLIHWWINCDPAFSDYRPALFEECYDSATGSLTFDDDGIKKVMPHVDRCIVVLCKDCFKEMLDICNEKLRDKGSKSEDKIWDEIRENLSMNIFYLEIRRALEYGVPLIPVHVGYERNGCFAGLDTSDLSKLSKLFGTSALTAGINPVSFDYSQVVTELMKNDWDVIEEEKLEQIVKSLETKGAVQKFRAELLRNCKERRKASSKKEGNIEDKLIDDLKTCAITILNNKHPRGEGVKLTAEEDAIIYDPVRAVFDHEKNEPFLAECLVKQFRKNKEALALQSSEFCYWDMNLNCTSPKKVAEFNVEAICFGILCVNHRLHKDSLVLEEGSVEPSQRVRFEEAIRSGINLLLALRNPYTKTWPVYWSFNAKSNVIGMEGTINQVTLSLSTLLSCGFLETNAELSADVLRSRYEYISESVSELLSWMKKNETYRAGESIGWGYTKCSECAGILPTVFVFSTFCKLWKNISELKTYFRDQDTEFSQKLENDEKVIENTLCGVVTYLRERQSDSGDKRGALVTKEVSGFSMLHTAYAIRAMYQYTKCGVTQRVDVKENLKMAISYLLNAVKNRVEAGKCIFDASERFEKFCDSKKPIDSNKMKSNVGQKYEHCAELVIAETLVKIAEEAEEEETCERAKTLLRQIFDSYNEGGSIVRRDDALLIKSGKRGAGEYPISYLYYYRMFLLDYLSLLRKESEK